MALPPEAGKIDDEAPCFVVCVAQEIIGTPRGGGRAG